MPDANARTVTVQYAYTASPLSATSIPIAIGLLLPATRCIFIDNSTGPTENSH